MGFGLPKASKEGVIKLESERKRAIILLVHFEAPLRWPPQAEQVVKNRAYVIQRFLDLPERFRRYRRLSERHIEVIVHYETFGYIEKTTRSTN